MTKDLLKRYLRINVFTFIINFIGITILQYMDDFQDYPNYFYASRTFSIIAQMLPLSTITIFLNMAQSIREDFYARLLSFFFIPSCLVVHFYQQMFSIENIGLFFLVILPFYSIIFREFYLFNKSQLSKMTKDLLKRYLRINVFTYIINFILMLITLDMYFPNDIPTPIYRSILDSMGIAAIVQVLPLSTLTLFLNVRQSIREKSYARLLSFFLLPSILVIIFHILAQSVGLIFLILVIFFFLITFREFYLFNKKFPLQPS